MQSDVVTDLGLQDKSSGGPGLDGQFHTDALGFSDSVRCDGSTDVTRTGVPKDPYGAWLKSQPVADPAVAARYNVTDLFELKKARFAELPRVSMPGNRYAIEDTQPLNGTIYQDNWIGEQAIALLKRRPRDKPFFFEVSHQAPHPPMDVTAGMVAANGGIRSRIFPQPAECVMPACFSNASIQVGRQNYAAKIERLDYWLGRYLALLEQQRVSATTITCIASDHGEMLFDRGCTAKSRPWSSASSVPLICSGPGIATDAVVHTAVSTVDLGPTFLDFAGVLGAAPEGMSRLSMKAVMAAPSEAAVARRTVYFGLNNFRGVVQTINETHTLKFFCCASTSREPDSTTNGCPGSTAADRRGFETGANEYHLYNIAADRFESPASDLRSRYPEVVKEMAALLPAPHHTPPAKGSSIPGQGYGYRWPGCVIQKVL